MSNLFNLATFTYIPTIFEGYWQNLFRNTSYREIMFISSLQMGDLSPYIGQTASMGSKSRGSHTAASIFLSSSFRSKIGFPLLVLRLFTKCYGCSSNCSQYYPIFQKAMILGPMRVILLFIIMRMLLNSNLSYKNNEIYTSANIINKMPK